MFQATQQGLITTPTELDDMTDKDSTPTGAEADLCAQQTHEYTRIQIGAAKKPAAKPVPFSPQQKEPATRQKNGRAANQYAMTIICNDTGECTEIPFLNEHDREQALLALEGHVKAVERARTGRRQPREQDWVRVKQSALREYPKTSGYSHYYSGVLEVLVGNIKYGGRIPMPKDCIAEEAGVSLTTVYRAINHMIEHGYVVQAKHEGRKALFVTSKLCTKGYSQLKDTKRLISQIESDVSSTLLAEACK